MVEPTGPLQPPSSKPSVASSEEQPTFSTVSSSRNTPNRTVADFSRVDSAVEEHVPERAYQPLSLLAMAGGALAALYALTILFGAAMALYSGTPWLLSAWTILIPIVAAAISFLGWLSVRHSEGTLAGGKVAIWGMALSLLFTLGYWSYVAAIYFALQQQAEVFVATLFNDLRKGDVTAAFQLTLDPKRRLPNRPNVRQDLEIQFNGLSQVSPRGLLSAFEQHDLVRLLCLAGEDAKFECLGVQDWDFKADGYEVKLSYKITTPQATLTALVSARGTSSRTGEFTGRRWHVVWDGSGIAKNSLVLTPQGEALFRMMENARNFAQLWVKEVKQGNLGETYWQTRSRSEVSSLRMSYQARLWSHGLGMVTAAAHGTGPITALAQGACWSDDELMRQSYLAGYREFRDGSLVSAQKDDFWTPLSQVDREALVHDVKKLFQLSEVGQGQVLDLEQVAIPVVRLAQGRHTFAYDCRLHTGASPYLIEAALVLESDGATTQDPQNVHWRVRSLNLKRARTIPQDPKASSQGQSR